MLLWLLVPLAALLGYVAGRYQAAQFQNEGEALVRAAIGDALVGKAWHLLNNITLPVEDGTTQVDHILVSRYGIFVIETKHYKGWVFGDAHSRQWTQVLFKRKHRFQNPLHQNYKHVKAIQSLLEFLPPNHVESLVVFTGEAEFKSKKPEGVHSLDSMLIHLKSYDVEIITENRMQFCVGRLECQRLALTRETDIEHRQNLDRRHGNAP